MAIVGPKLQLPAVAVSAVEFVPKSMFLLLDVQVLLPIRLPMPPLTFFFFRVMRLNELLIVHSRFASLTNVRHCPQRHVSVLVSGLSVLLFFLSCGLDSELSVLLLLALSPRGGPRQPAVDGRVGVSS